MAYVLLIFLAAVPAPWWAVMASRKPSTPRPSKLAVFGGLGIASVMALIMLVISSAMLPTAVFNAAQTDVAVSDINALLVSTRESHNIESAWTSAYGGYCLVAAVDPDGVAGWDAVASTEEDCSIALFNHAQLKNSEDIEDIQIAATLATPVWQPAMVVLLIYGAFVFTLAVLHTRTENPGVVTGGDNMEPGTETDPPAPTDTSASDDPATKARRPSPPTPTP